MQRVGCVLVRVTAQPPVAVVHVTVLHDLSAVLSVLVVLAADFLRRPPFWLGVDVVISRHVSIGKDLATQRRLVRVSIAVAVIEATGDALTTGQIGPVFPLADLLLNRLVSGYLLGVRPFPLRSVQATRHRGCSGWILLLGRRRRPSGTTFSCVIIIIMSQH